MAEHLLACPNDILFLVLENCDHRSIHHLTLTSKLLRSTCISQLYQNVDLSSHNLGRMREFEEEGKSESWSNMDDSIGPKNLLSRQRSFLRTMVDHPEYSAYIRAFTWTLIWYQYPEQELTEIDYHLWDIFSRFTRVVKLDLAALPLDKDGGPYTRLIPPVLFPLVVELRLSGWMPHQLVVNIFNSMDLSRLRSLTLDTLQEEGHVPSGEPMPEDISKEYWDCEWRTRLCELGTIDQPPMDVNVIFPGPMWLTIVPLIGRLNSLEYLEIRIPPLEDDRTYSGLSDCPEYLHSISVIVELVASTYSSLHQLTIDYACPVRWNGSNSSHINPAMFGLNQRRLRHSKQILRSFLPCLVMKEWRWETLHKISLAGFLHNCEMKTNPRAFTAMEDIKTIQRNIEDSLAIRGTVLEWLDDSPRPARLFLGHDIGISEQALNQLYQALELARLPA